MAKWGDKWQGKKGEIQTGLEKEVKVNGEPGNQNENRLEILNAIADRSDEVRKESLADVTTESYEDLPGTAETIEKQAAEATDDTEEEQTEVKQEEAKVEEPRKYKLKINGVEQEVTEEELIARAQKVGAADQYLSEAAKLYAEAKNPASQSKTDDGAKVEEDYLALARAIQMGSEEDAVNAIKKIAQPKQTLSKDEVVKIADSRYEQRLSFQRDLTRFQDDYKDLLANDVAKALVMELDEAAHLKGKPPGYERFKEAAESVSKLMKIAEPSSLTEKEQRKASVKVVVGSGAKQPVQAEEKEPTVSETIRDMAKVRGQSIVRAGN